MRVFSCKWGEYECRVRSRAYTKNGSRADVERILLFIRVHLLLILFHRLLLLKRRVLYLPQDLVHNALLHARQNDRPATITINMTSRSRTIWMSQDWYREPYFLADANASMIGSRNFVTCASLNLQNLKKEFVMLLSWRLEWGEWRWKKIPNHGRLLSTHLRRCRWNATWDPPESCHH